jgi:tetratricopeptide (TPR) repeat protein
MPDIALRTYVQQLDTLIERKHIDEAIAHCRHILSYFPKHLDTYRMLGKALLEKGRHGDAADVFQRVLSVLPDDFISHVGMAIVREDEANLDAALWHMERAFEAMPSNGAIQQELCRLYGRRDGVVPPKARLTRGALGRMYAQGGLYRQAEAELKAALAEDQDRIDLSTLLAKTYWLDGQPAEAAPLCGTVLQKLPYSQVANRVLVDIFTAQ